MDFLKKIKKSVDISKTTCYIISTTDETLDLSNVFPQLYFFALKYDIILLEVNNMDEFTEKRFGHLRQLSKDEKLTMIRELEDDIVLSEKMIEDKSVSGEQKTELYSDISYDRQVIEYLITILNEKTM